MRLSNFIAPGITLALFIVAVVAFYLLKDESINRFVFEEWASRLMWFVIGGVATSLVEGLVSGNGGPRR